MTVSQPVPSFAQQSRLMTVRARQIRQDVDRLVAASQIRCEQSLLYLRRSAHAAGSPVTESRIAPP
ncbi:MAG: hypothetical protein KY451_14020 [Actinobacteria bacterium]|nr:hypothetical protein [Actinomycetota bacterium]MBW3647573.1 hypothetical protein [Actinomycetota bacterium]